MCPGRARADSPSLAGHGLRTQVKVVACIIGPDKSSLGVPLPRTIAAVHRFCAVSPGGLTNKGQRGREEIAVFAPSVSHGSSAFEISVATPRSHGTAPCAKPARQAFMTMAFAPGTM